MKPEEVFKRYDIRGRYPEEIDEEFAKLLGKSVGTFAERQVVVCKDTKQSSEKLKRSVIEGLKTTGTDLLDAGTGPTDYAAFKAVKHESVGLQVTSSHMPLAFNGFKLIYPEGNGFMNEDLDAVKKIFRHRDFDTGESEMETVDGNQDYLDKMEEFFLRHFEKVDRKIVVEKMNGAGILPEILERLGAEVTEIDREIDPPDPEPGRLEHVERKVDESADMGLVTDMDADRIAVYDGEWLDGNDIFSILIQVIQPEKVVASIDTSRKVEETLADSETFYTRVGDPFVAEKMLEVDAELSGEPNGHFCFPEFVAYNSGTLAGLMIAGADTEKFKQEIPEYYSRRKSVDVEDKKKAMEKLKKRVKGRFSVLSEIDGIKFRTGDAEVLVRSSGSSEKLRIVADAPTEEEAYVAVEKAGMMI